MSKKRQVKDLSWKDYCPHPGLPKLMTARDILFHQVNKEAELMYPERSREVPALGWPEKPPRKTPLMVHIVKTFLTV